MKCFPPPYGASRGTRSSQGLEEGRQKSCVIKEPPGKKKVAKLWFTEYFIRLTASRLYVSNPVTFGLTIVQNCQANTAMVPYLTWIYLWLLGIYRPGLDRVEEKISEGVSQGLG